MITYKAFPMDSNEDFIDVARELDPEFAEALEKWLYKLTDIIHTAQDDVDDLQIQIKNVIDEMEECKDYVQSLVTVLYD